MIQPVDPAYYDQEYYTTGTKSNYAPYGPGAWADWLVEMLVEHLHPKSVLDIGCAYGFVVERLWNRRGIQAWGFDVSRFAIGLGSARLWVGDCTDPKAYRQSADVGLCTEVGEHLTPDQARKLLENGLAFTDRMLMLIAVDLGEEPEEPEKDGSHIHVVPMSWWEELAREVGWTVSDASAFNDDWRSRQMQWSGRWLYLEKEV